MATVGRERRREILALLRNDERTVTEIVDALQLTQSAASKHLRVLRDVGLVTGRRAGREMFYRTNAAGIEPVYAWASMFERYFTNQLIRVKARAESAGRDESRVSTRRQG